MRYMKRIAMIAGISLSLCLGGCSGTAAPEMAADTGRAERMLLQTLSALDKNRYPVRSQAAEIVSGDVVIAAPEPRVLAATWGPWTADCQEAAKLLQILDRSVKLERPLGAGTGDELVVTPEREAWTRIMREALEGRIGALRQAEESLGDPAARESAAAGLDLLAEASRSLEAEGTCTIRLDKATGRPQQLVLESRISYTGKEERRNETIRTSYHF